MKQDHRKINELLAGVIGTFMGRDALQFAASVLKLKPADVALLPAYLCVEVLKPFASRCRVEFYDVGADTAIDPLILESQLIRHRPKVVLFINYFGFLQPHGPQLRELCAAHGALLIEDCAHSLLTEGSGETGDWTIHSFRKILPLPDGGGIKTNRAAERLQPRFHPRIRADVLSALIVLKTLLKVRSPALSRARLSSRGKLLTGQADASVQSPRLLPMSILARYRMRHLDLTRIVRRRRDDFQFWLDWSSRTEGVTPLFDHLPVGVCPYGFPIFVRNRDQLKAQLEKKGLLIRTHWHLPEAVGSEFANSHRLAEETLTLPLFHEFDEQQRRRVG